jgi:hypothetical protein
MALALNSHAAFTAPDSNGDIWTLIRGYHVGNGPAYTSNPQVYSALEAAELIFGAPGPGTTYAISISLGFVTHTAVLDGWGDHTGKIFAEDFSHDSGNPGYNDPGEVGAAYSAYVNDGAALFAAGDVNYVWQRTVTPVPEPSTFVAGALLVIAFGVQGVRRLRQRKQTA